MTTITLRFDDAMKKELDEMVEEMGMNLTTFFTIYAKRALRDRKIPFEISARVTLSTPVVEQKLDEADCFVEAKTERSTKDEVFSGVRSSNHGERWECNEK